MRRKDRKLNEQDAFEILENGEYGILSTMDVDNTPYAVPLNYCVANNKIYFHCAKKGKKLDTIKANPKVSFCVVGKTEIEPEQFATKYESCIINGIAGEAVDQEKQMALEGLVEKYSGDFIEEGAAYIKKLSHQTTIIGITINSISGKAKH